MLLLDVIDQKEEQFLLDFINKQEWNTCISRRTQHYGFEYNYKTRDAVPCKPIPSEFHFLLERLGGKFDQLIINEYKSNQGISRHKDSNVFDNKIVSLTLGNQDEMCLYDTYEQRVPTSRVTLFRRSLYILQGDERYKMFHEIRKKKRTFPRISMTFRRYL